MSPFSAEQIHERLRVENPWWQAPHTVPAMFADLPHRLYFDLFYSLATNRQIRRAVVLLGPRRVGKTVMIHHAIQRLLAEGTKPTRICYVSMDHPVYGGLTLDDLIKAHQAATREDTAAGECYWFFDEIQYLRDWESYLKAIVDRSPGLKCVASGSAGAALRVKSRQSGAGRFTDFLLPPLTFHEYLALSKEYDVAALKERLSDGRPLAAADLSHLNTQFLNYLNFGGYPELALSSEIRRDPNRFVKSDILDKVLLRDLPGLYGIEDTQELNSFFAVLAFNIACEVSLDSLSKKSGVAKAQIKQYIEYLEAAFLIHRIHRLDISGRRFRKADFFKVYLTNPCLRTALFAPVAADDEAAGAMVETGVLAHLFPAPHPVHYARWRKNGEVDIIHLGPDRKVMKAVEVKWSDSVVRHPTALKSLLTFCREHNLASATVTTRTVHRLETRENVSIAFIPSSLYCFSLSSNLEAPLVAKNPPE